MAMIHLILVFRYYFTTSITTIEMKWWWDILSIDSNGSLSQSDDILGEIVGESTTREAKRQKLNKASNDDDLFEDFGEIDKVRMEEERHKDHLYS